MTNLNKSFNFRNGVQVDDDNFIVNANATLVSHTRTGTTGIGGIYNHTFPPFVKLRVTIRFLIFPQELHQIITDTSTLLRHPPQVLRQPTQISHPTTPLPTLCGFSNNDSA